jgi:hypothetical protein
MIAPAEPMIATQRQPSRPSGLSGKRCDRIRGQTDRRDEGKSRAAALLWHELRQVGVDCDELYADADPCDKAPENKANGRRLD